MSFARASVWVAVVMITGVGCEMSMPGGPSLPLGSPPPEITASDWLNSESPPTLAALRGEVVLLEFWATWCGPCVAGIPHMNELHEKYASEGLRIISFTDEDRPTIEAFQRQSRSPIQYTIGVGSGLGGEYGVTGIPHAFIVGRDGNLIWHGHPASPECEQRVKAALADKTGAPSAAS